MSPFIAVLVVGGVSFSIFAHVSICIHADKIRSWLAARRARRARPMERLEQNAASLAHIATLIAVQNDILRKSHQSKEASK